jgi:aminoglycoside phosphotransferase (APT) family kinase protein
VDTLAETLRATMPRDSATSIVHGDFRIDNVIVDHDDPGTIRAVLDWEMATLGDPLADLATLIMFWDETGRAFNPITGGLSAFEGFPTAADVARRYADRRGLTVSGLEWYLVFSQFKLAVILEQIHVRHASGQTRGEGFDGIDRMVDQLLAEAVTASATLHTPRPPEESS